MLGIGFWKRKPRQFDYRPRYYDPEKEAREERRRELLGDYPDEVDEDGQKKEYVPGQYIRRNMMARREMPGTRSTKRKTGMTRAIIALALLGLALYWVLT